MKLSILNRDFATILTLTGKLDTWDLLDIGPELKHAIESSTTDVIVDLAALDEISGTGINVLVACHAWLKERGRILVLAAAAGAVAESLRLRRVSEQVYVMRSIEAARTLLAPTLEVNLNENVEQPGNVAEFGSN